MAKVNYETDLSGELSPANALQSDFDEAGSTDSDERYLVRPHSTIQHCDQTMKNLAFERANGSRYVPASEPNEA